jgi:uncharacterized membrane protein YozB (DUF420 family)
MGVSWMFDYTSADFDSKWTMPLWLCVIFQGQALVWMMHELSPAND